MSIYPDVITSIPATLPIEYAGEQAILSTEFENGIESRRLIWNFVRRNVRINYSVMTFANSNSLRRFFEDRKGPFLSFSFFCPQIEYYYKEYVGTALANETILRLPSKDAQSYDLYRNGALVNQYDYIFTSSGGPDGEDLIEIYFTSNPGDRYNFSFTGRLKIKSRFAESALVFRDIKNLVSSTTVTLKALEPQL